METCQLENLSFCIPLLFVALLDGEWQDLNFSSLGFASFNIIISPPPLFLKKKKQKTKKHPKKPNPTQHPPKKKPQKTNPN